jgi:hypothetical protein
VCHRSPRPSLLVKASQSALAPENGRCSAPLLLVSVCFFVFFFFAFCSLFVQALHKFDGDDETRLPLNPGDTIAILERGFAWFKGRNLDTDCVGIFPSNYVQVLPGGFKEDDSAPNATDAMFLKSSQAMLEWGELMNGWLREGMFAKASLIQCYIETMIKCRTQMLNPKADADRRKAAKRDMKLCISRCTTDLGLSFTVKGCCCCCCCFFFFFFFFCFFFFCRFEWGVC